MKIPDKLKVAGHVYDIVFDDERLSNEDCIGLVNHNGLRIYLAKNHRGVKLGKSVSEENLLHEILHTIDVCYNNHSLDEKTIDRLSEGLYQVLKDNFKF